MLQIFCCWLKCCYTSTETEGLLGTGAQDSHLNFHTAPELWILNFYFYRLSSILPSPRPAPKNDHKENRHPTCTYYWTYATVEKGPYKWQKLHQHQGLAGLALLGENCPKQHQKPTLLGHNHAPKSTPPPKKCTTSKTQCRNADKSVAKHHEYMTILWKKS